MFPLSESGFVTKDNASYSLPSQNNYETTIVQQDLGEERLMSKRKSSDIRNYNLVNQIQNIIIDANFL